MIGVRVQCDADDCGRHFEVAGDIDMGPVKAQRGTFGQPFVIFGTPFVALPADWTAGPAPDGRGVQVLCGEHSVTDDG